MVTNKQGEWHLQNNLQKCTQHSCCVHFFKNMAASSPLQISVRDMAAVTIGKGPKVNYSQIKSTGHVLKKFNFLNGK
jgi:hypothetical protein